MKMKSKLERMKQKKLLRERKNNVEIDKPTSEKPLKSGQNISQKVQIIQDKMIMTDGKTDFSDTECVTATGNEVKYLGCKPKIRKSSIDSSSESPKCSVKKPKKICKKSVFGNTAKITSYFESKIKTNETKIETMSSKNRTLSSDPYENDRLFSDKLIKRNENSMKNGTPDDNRVEKSDNLSQIKSPSDISLSLSPSTKSYDVESSSLSTDRSQQLESDQSLVRLPNRSPILSCKSVSFFPLDFIRKNTEKGRK